VRIAKAFKGGTEMATIDSTKTEQEQYDAFISYNKHDKEFARELKKALEAYKPPKGLGLPDRYLHIFIWEKDMDGIDYEEAIKDKLKKSAKLIVICSPAARQSKNIDDEITWFIQLVGAEKIVPILLAGVPNNEAEPEQAAEMAYPEELGQVLKIPLGSDYRGFNRGFLGNPFRDKVNKWEFSNAWYNLLANLLGRTRQEIEQRDLKRKRKWRYLGWAIAIIIAGSAA
jgi:hypothetical protein